MLHIILCMLVDWTKHPHHARAMLLRNRPSGEQQRPPQEEGDIEKTKEEEEGSADDSEQEQEAVDNDTAQYLLDLCGHLCTTLPLVDESLPMLRPLMQLYHNLAVVLVDQSAPLCSSSAQAMTLTHSHFFLLLLFFSPTFFRRRQHPLLARWQHIARFRQVRRQTRLGDVRDDPLHCYTGLLRQAWPVAGREGLNWAARDGQRDLHRHGGESATDLRYTDTVSLSPLVARQYSAMVPDPTIVILAIPSFHRCASCSMTKSNTT